MAQLATAQLKYLHMAPRKVRLVASLLRGMHVREAQAQLSFQSRRAADPIMKLLKSAIANAKQLKMNPDKLIVSEIRVDQGPMAKRMMPRAMGRGVAIQKKMSHISITLAESETKTAPAYVFVDSPKKKKTGTDSKKTKKGASADKTVLEKKGGGDHAHEHESQHEHEASNIKKSKPLTGFSQKFFRRKAGGE